MANTSEQSLATQILNFVAPYIPDHIREEALKIIGKSARHNYAHTTIQWKDDGREEDAIISLCGFDEKHDDEILFYCENEEGLERLKDYDNGEDFFISGCVLFTEEL